MRDPLPLRARLAFALAALLALLGACAGATAPYACLQVYGVATGTDQNGNRNHQVTGYQFCGSPPRVPRGFFLDSAAAARYLGGSVP